MEWTLKKREIGSGNEESEPLPKKLKADDSAIHPPPLLDDHPVVPHIPSHRNGRNETIVIDPDEERVCAEERTPTAAMKSSTNLENDDDVQLIRVEAPKSGTKSSPFLDRYQVFSLFVCSFQFLISCVCFFFLQTFYKNSHHKLSSSKQGKTFAEILDGDVDPVPYISPFTGRALKPFIWRNFACRPKKLELLEEITCFPHL
jgi:hypothetical protein